MKLSRCKIFNKFEDILKMNIPEWVLYPFSNLEIIDSPTLEDEFMDVTTNEELKLKFKEGYKLILYCIRLYQYFFLFFFK